MSPTDKNHKNHKKPTRGPQKSLENEISEMFVFVEAEAVDDSVVTPEPEDVRILESVHNKIATRRIRRKLLAQAPFIVESPPDLDILSVSPEFLLANSSIPEHRKAVQREQGIRSPV
ncbi:unnamed protein product [Dicrocoelium dendriticum]|nr:unnamed protein product [Dicrocoelium dendriticum]